jgi:hypothetical protein
MIQPIENPTTDRLIQRIYRLYAETNNKLVTERNDIESMEFMRGSLYAYRNISILLGKDLTLVVKESQEGVKV